jgi:cell division protease FtsH
VAEELIFHRISTGASNDIKQATALAQKMIRTWGMSDQLGPLSYDQGEEQIFLGREIAQHRDYSEATAQKIDQEVSQLIRTAYERARKILEEHMEILHKLAELLLEKETVMGQELDEMILDLKPDAKLQSQSSEEDNPSMVIQ